MQKTRRMLLLSGLSLLSALGLSAQAPPSQAPAAPAAPANPFQMSPEERARLDQLAREDHADMLRQLGITKLRPGPNGRAAAGEPNAANYDPAKANPYPDWPDVLTLKNGQKVTTARDVVAEAPSRDRRGLRARGLRPRAEGRAEGHVDGGRDRRDDASAASRSSPGA